MKMMADSFHETSEEDNCLMIFIDKCDPCLEEYFSLLKDDMVVVNDRMTNTKIFNFALSRFPKCEYYHMTNDDFIYKTPGWDSKFVHILENKRCGIAYGNDLLQGQSMATAPFISGDIVRALGWLQLPDLDYLGGDVVWQTIGHKIDRLFYLPDVIIEHVHYQAKKAEIDETYKNTNSPARYEKDGQAFKKWIKERRIDLDVLKVRIACGL